MQKTIQGKRLLKSHTQANLDKRKWNRKQIWMYVELGSRKWLRFIKLKLYSHPPSWCMMFYHLFNVKWNLAHFTPALAHFTPWVVQFPPWLISPRATLRCCHIETLSYSFPDKSLFLVALNGINRNLPKQPCDS